MAYRVRRARDVEELRAALGPIGHYFGWQPTPEDGERLARLLPVERTHLALDGTAVVAGTGVHPLQLTIPGGPVPCAGVTVVGVLPTHRRRGLLGRMMRAQLADVRERGEPLAALFASEETIYGRFGYGLASLCQVDMRLPRAYARLADGGPARGGAVRLVGHEEALEAFPPVYERVRRGTVGFLSRSRDWWELRRLDDEPERRRGSGPLNRALLELDGQAAGYALYRVKSEFDGALNVGQVRVLEAVGISPRATRELWRFLLGIDWLGEIQCFLLPLDHPLVHLVANPNRMRWLVADGIWLRVVDVAAALAARSYAADGRVTLEVVADPQFADNVATWTVEDGAVRRSRRRPDVRLDVQALGSAFLGGFSFTALAAAGRVEEAARGGLARADRQFRTDRQPWIPEIF
jgi:predicted acetyltransferase